MVVRVLGTIVHIPEFVIRSIFARPRFPAVRPWITDPLRARIIAWASLGAIFSTALVYYLPWFQLQDQFTDAAKKWHGWILTAVLALIGFCFWLGHGKGPSSDLDAAITGFDEEPGSTPGERAFFLRVIIVASFVWVGALIHWTGGPMVSPFSTYAVIAVILGLFLSSTTETPFAIMVAGIALFTVLTYWCHPAPVWRAGFAPLESGALRTWRLLMTSLAFVVSVAVSQRSVAPSKTT